MPTKVPVDGLIIPEIPEPIPLEEIDDFWQEMPQQEDDQVAAEFQSVEDDTGSSGDSEEPPLEYTPFDWPEWGEIEEEVRNEQEKGPGAEVQGDAAVP